MNNFFYLKNPEKGFTTNQFKSIHNSLQNLGYSKTFSEFYSELAEACSKEYEDCTLMDKKVASLISEKILQILESLSCPDIRSKIFALASLQNKQQTQVFIPTIYFTRQSILGFLEEAKPELVPYVEELKGLEYFPGFANPVTKKSETLTYQPKEESVIGILTSEASKVRLKDGKKEEFKELQKASISVLSEGQEYTIPIFRTAISSGIIDSFFEKKEGIVFSEKKVMLLPKEYMEEQSSMFGLTQKNPLLLP